MRLAGDVFKKGLSFLQNNVLPKGKLETALEWSPDVLMAGLMSLRAPGGMGTKLAVGGEDLVHGLGSSLVGRALGAGLASRLPVGHPLKEHLPLMTSMGTSMTWGMFGPRPVLDKAFQAEQERQMRAQTEAAADQPEARQRQMQEQAQLQPQMDEEGQGFSMLSSPMQVGPEGRDLDTEIIKALLRGAGGLEAARLNGLVTG
jgi:hypothetical protein